MVWIYSNDVCAFEGPPAVCCAGACRRTVGTDSGILQGATVANEQKMQIKSNCRMGLGLNARLRVVNTLSTLSAFLHPSLVNHYLVAILALLYRPSLVPRPLRVCLLPWLSNLYLRDACTRACVDAPGPSAVVQVWRCRGNVRGY